ncbi:MAG: tyrosine-type recombinase/integrase [Acidimicrobiales bacterium]
MATQRTRGLHGRMIEGDPKWGSARRMAVPDALLDLLGEHLRRPQLSESDVNEPVCTSPGGEALHYSNWRRPQWVPACAAAGMPELTFHALRSANTTAMVALDVDVKTAQTRAGHRNALTTLNVYARPTGDGDRAGARQLGEYFLSDQAPTDDIPPQDARRDRRPLHDSKARHPA